jgi:hypothetical protein
MAGTGEPEVVWAEDLGRILRSARYRWDALHPEQNTTWLKQRTHRKAQITFQTYLSHRCRMLDPSGIGINPRRIYGLIRGTEQKYVGLWTADLVLTALGLNDLLDTEELPVFPNPRWSQGKFDAYMSAACSETAMVAPTPTGRIEVVPD